MAKRPHHPDRPGKAQRSEQISAALKQEDRKALLERLMFIVAPILLVAIAVVIFFAKRGGDSDAGEPGAGDKMFQALGEVGVSPLLAGCDQPTNDPVPPNIPVAQPGKAVKYLTVPPSFGPYLAQPATINAAGFHTAADRPPMEALVANLNAGWTVLWYDPRPLGSGQVELIKAAAGLLHNDPRYSTFVAVEWDTSYGEFPVETPLALVRWSKTTPQTGHRAFCTQASGEAFRQFMAVYGAPKIVGVDP